MQESTRLRSSSADAEGKGGGTRGKARVEEEKEWGWREEEGESRIVRGFGKGRDRERRWRKGGNMKVGRRGLTRSENASANLSVHCTEMSKIQGEKPQKRSTPLTAQTPGPNRLIFW